MHTRLLPQVSFKLFFTSSPLWDPGCWGGLHLEHCLWPEQTERGEIACGSWNIYLENTYSTTDKISLTRTGHMATSNFKSAECCSPSMYLKESWKYLVDSPDVYPVLSHNTRSAQIPSDIKKKFTTCLRDYRPKVQPSHCIPLQMQGLQMRLWSCLVSSFCRDL